MASGTLVLSFNDYDQLFMNTALYIKYQWGATDYESRLAAIDVLADFDTEEELESDTRAYRMGV